MMAAALLNASMCAAAVTIAFEAALVNEVISLFCHYCGGMNNAVISTIIVFITIGSRCFSPSARSDYYTDV